MKAEDLKAILDSLPPPPLQIITCEYLPGAVFLVDPGAISISLMRPMPKLLMPGVDYEADGYRDRPYDKTRIPVGHEPVMLLSDGDWLHDADRYRLNNELIKLFGTRPKNSLGYQFKIEPWWSVPKGPGVLHLGASA
jgi:hypothetical protein